MLNFAVHNEHWNIELENALFSDNDGNKEFVQPIKNPNMDMWDLLVGVGLFKSKSDARKNWTKTGKEIPQGFTLIPNVGKLKVLIAIWNPIPCKED